MDKHNQTTRDNDSGDTAISGEIANPAILTITALVRWATDDDGNGPSAGAIRTYVADGLIKPLKDTTGRSLFRRSDAKLALQIYKARRERHGATGRRVQALTDATRTRG